MAATRPAILAALKALLVAQVTAVAGKVYLPWDDQPETATAPLLQVDVADTDVNPDQIIGLWEHTILVRIGAVVTGKFNYQSAWDLLDAVSAAIQGNATLSGLATRIEITGAADHVTVAGDKLLWPHLSATIIYRTTRGTL
jgi:hypothetical protein